MPFDLALTAAVDIRPAARRKGGKPAARRLRKPVTQQKRTSFLLYCMAAYGRTVGDCMERFGISRANVFSYLSTIHREHGIGYAVKSDRITILLPPDSTRDSVFIPF